MARLGLQARDPKVGTAASLRGIPSREILTSQRSQSSDHGVVLHHAMIALGAQVSSQYN
jgi:hypothetical protein